MDPLERLIEKIQQLQADAQAIRDAAEADKRDFTPEEAEELDAILGQIDEAMANKTRLERLEKTKAAMVAKPGRKIDPELQPRADIRPVTTARDRNRWGFSTFGDYLKAVVHSSGPGSKIDDRILNAQPSTVGTEGVGPDGGFAVPPDFRSEIAELIGGEDSLLARTDQQVSSSNTFTVPVDETTPWQSSGGILTYWVGENAQITESKPALREVTLKLHKLAALVPITEELMQDAPAMERYVRGKAASKINFELNRVIVQGTGAGQPLGILKAPCLVSVAKEGSQTADTVNMKNIVKMWGRMYAPSRRNAVWLMQQDVEQQILQLADAGNFSVYMPPGGLSASPYGTILGRPVIATQACETVGDLGDIFFVDLTQYLTVTRALRQDMSIHLYFDYDAVAFRFILRVAGQPWWSAAASSRDGSNTISPFIALAERA